MTCVNGDHNGDHGDDVWMMCKWAQCADDNVSPGIVLTEIR